MILLIIDVDFNNNEMKIKSILFYHTWHETLLNDNKTFINYFNI
jgi:hypothetical protein